MIGLVLSARLTLKKSSSWRLAWHFSTPLGLPHSAPVALLDKDNMGILTVQLGVHYEKTRKV